MKTSSLMEFATTLRAFFTQYLPLTRGLSPRTVSNYRDSFVLLLRYLATRHHCDVVDVSLQHLDVKSLLAFLDYLETERKNSVATRNARLAAIHSFARFLATRNPEQMETAQRLLGVPIKRGPSRTIDYLEEHEIRAMLEAVSPQRQDHARDRAMLLTLFNTGARVQELLDIRAGDLQLTSPASVLLHGKGRKQRLCPLWPETADAIQALLSVIHVSTTDGVPVFRNHRGEPMTRFGVRYLLRHYAEKALPSAPSLSSKHVHPHTYRHSSAVHLLRAGVDLVTISHWLGHASIETTNRYAAVNLETKRKALEQAGPIVAASGSKAAAWRTKTSILQWLEAL
jgi:integrase/recombinase XerD